MRPNQFLHLSLILSAAIGFVACKAEPTSRRDEASINASHTAPAAPAAAADAEAAEEKLDGVNQAQVQQAQTNQLQLDAQAITENIAISRASLNLEFTPADISCIHAISSATSASGRGFMLLEGSQVAYRKSATNNAESQFKVVACGQAAPADSAAEVTSNVIATKELREGNALVEQLLLSNHAIANQLPASSVTITCAADIADERARANNGIVMAHGSRMLVARSLPGASAPVRANVANNETSVNAAEDTAELANANNQLQEVAATPAAIIQYTLISCN